MTTTSALACSSYVSRESNALAVWRARARRSATTPTAAVAAAAESPMPRPVSVLRRVRITAGPDVDPGHSGSDTRDDLVRDGPGCLRPVLRRRLPRLSGAEQSHH